MSRAVGKPINSIPLFCYCLLCTRFYVEVCQQSDPLRECTLIYLSLFVGVAQHLESKGLEEGDAKRLAKSFTEKLNPPIKEPAAIDVSAVSPLCAPVAGYPVMDHLPLPLNGSEINI